MYLDGRYVEVEKAVISPFDHGFLYGMGLFETFRTYNGSPFLLDQHLARLNKGLQEMSIQKSFNSLGVLEIIEKLSNLNQLTNSYIRMNVSAGTGEIGLTTEPYQSPTVIMFQKPLPVMVSLNEKEAVILSIKRNTPETDNRLKSHHFYNNIAAKRELGPDPKKEGIFLTHDGFLAEGITSNLFWIKNDTLFTPDLATGILNGITRQFILTLARKRGMKIKEGFFPSSDLKEVDEIFFTNSIQEIVPVNLLDGREYPGKNGYHVNGLNKLYQLEIEKLKK